MKIKAIANSGKNLSYKYLGAFDNAESFFPINIGDIYTVYGINIWAGGINYLTFDKWGHYPSWYPAELFEIVDNRLPSEWHFHFYGYKNNELLNAVLGYKELALNPEHYNQLAEREGLSMYIFNQRKKEIDDFHDQIEKA
jgi:hypothetical protein